MEKGEVQEIANIATAFAKLGVVDHKNYFDALSERVCERIKKNWNASEHC